jgi:hypothetical protein
MLQGCNRVAIPIMEGSRWAEPPVKVSWKIYNETGVVWERKEKRRQ